MGHCVLEGKSNIILTMEGHKPVGLLQESRTVTAFLGMLWGEIQKLCNGKYIPKCILLSII